MLFRRDKLLVSEFVERWDPTISEHFVGFDTRAIESALEQIVSRVTATSSRSSFRASISSHYYEALAKALQPKSRFERPRQGFSDPQQPFFDALLGHLEVDVAKLAYLHPILDIERTKLVATLNYDLAVEKAAEQVGVEVDYGLDSWERQKRVDWRRKPCLRLLKLHGSVNWTGHAEQVKVRTDKIGPYERRLMIFGGTENKLSSAGPFLQFLYRFERSLFNTGALLVVGYSFRDPHINAVLQRWRLTRSNTEMTVVDPTPPDLWQLGFPTSGGKLRTTEGRTKRMAPVTLINQTASVGIGEFFNQPALDFASAKLNLGGCRVEKGHDGYGSRVERPCQPDRIRRVGQSIVRRKSRISPRRQFPRKPIV